MGILSYGYKARNVGKAIKSVPIAKNLTKKRADTDKAFNFIGTGKPEMPVGGQKRMLAEKKRNSKAY